MATMITLDEIKRICQEFEEKEKRSYFYYLALEIKDDYPLQASLLLLSVWNIARLNILLINRQNIIDLKNALNYCKHLFKELEKCEFKTVNFDEIGDKIKEVYNILSRIKGIEYTGASKIFHLFCPKLIVMWDTHIRNEYKKKKYENKYGLRIEGSFAENFLNFQKLMQRIFGHIEWDDKKNTLPKAIDEYNYVMFTLSRKFKK